MRRRSGNDQGQLKYEGLIEVDKILPKVQDVLQDNSKRGTAAPGVEICICCCEFSIRIPRTTKERRKERDKRACDRSAFVTIFSCFAHPCHVPVAIGIQRATDGSFIHPRMPSRLLMTTCTQQVADGPSRPFSIATQRSFPLAPNNINYHPHMPCHCRSEHLHQRAAHRPSCSFGITPQQSLIIPHRKSPTLALSLPGDHLLPESGWRTSLVQEP